MGLPTSADYAAVEADRDAALEQADAADARAADAQRAIERAAASADRVEQRRARLAEQYAMLTGQLAEAVRQGATAIVAGLEPAIDGVRLELASLDDARAGLDESVAAARRALDASVADRAAARAGIEELDAEIERMRAYTAERLDGVAGAVRAAGSTLTAWGVPGAAPLADKAAGVIGPGGVVGGLLASTLGAGYVRERRRRTAVTRGVAEIVAANKVTGLIVEDKTKRDAARQILSPGARRVYAAARTDAEQLIPAKRGALTPVRPPVVGG